MKTLNQILEKTDDYLYHATDTNNAKSIKHSGLKAWNKSGHKNYDFSKKKVYLASTPKEAKSFMPGELRHHAGIKKPTAIFKVKKSNLDTKHLKRDTNSDDIPGDPNERNKNFEYGKSIHSMFLFKMRNKNKK